MSNDLKVSLVIRGDGKGARKAAQEAQAGLRDTGKAARTAGDQVKQAAAGQAAAIKAQSVKTTAALGEVKKAGVGAGEAIKRGMSEGVREERRVGEEAERMGGRLQNALRRVADARGVFRALGRTATAEFARIKGALGTMQGRLASVGVGLAVGNEIRASAQFDRSLLRTRQTAGMSRAQQNDLRGNLWQMARTNGNPLESLTGGFDTLIASGLSYDAAKTTIGAIDVGTTISGADSEVLAKGLLVGAKAYEFDLTQPGQALELLEKMIVAGRAGNAELESLADIFARVGPAAKEGGMGFDQSLALVETLSGLESQPERLGTLAESTTRLFTNEAYLKNAAKATGVSFFNKDESRRDLTAILSDMKMKYDRLSTDKQRMEFVSGAFGKADQDTRKGVQFLLSGTNLATLSQTQSEIGQAKGISTKDLAENRESTTAVAGRMRNTLREAMDRMAQPINKAMADAGSVLLDDLNLSGGQMIGLAAGTAVAGSYAGRAGKFGLGKLGTLLGGGMDTVKNIAVGKALQDSTGVMPVFVTNWSGAPVSSGVEVAGSALAVAGKAAGPGKAVGALASVARTAAWTAAGYGAFEAIHSALAPAREALDSYLTAQGKASEGEHHTLTPEQVERRRRIQTQSMPYGQWLERPENTGKYGFTNPGFADYEAWTNAQARGGDVGGIASAGLSEAQLVQGAALLNDAIRTLQGLVGTPLQVNVSADMPWLHAEIGRSVERDARRGP